MSSKLLGNKSQGLAFVISAPAGTGKTTLVQKLVQEFSCVTASISYTTRPPRAGEIEGKDYYFLNRETFEEKMHAGEFLEWVNLHGYYYGTSRQWVEEEQKKGKHVLLTIDTQGALILKGNFPAIFIFIKPPSLEELGKRLVNRMTESETVIKERLEWAKRELAASDQYDYNIVNDNLEIAYETLRSILIAEEHRVKYNVLNS